jgi:tetratricopeptide (TPR) repeat protein
VPSGPARGGDSTGPAAQVGRPGPTSEPPPRQLPPDVSGFTGRDAELDFLNEALEGCADPDASRVCCVSGTAGVGKTALALHWAHQVSHRFPDGQLYLDLRGFGPDRPMDPAEGLEILLRAVRGDGFEPPPGLEARSGRFRSALAGLRILLILDNAASAEQVRPLLPAGAGCLTIVTSRYALPALVARDGARRLNISPLQIAAAADVLRGLLGDRADAEPDSVVSLARRCAGLPLMLRVAAEVALSRPYTTLADLLAEADSQDGWLDLLDTLGDDRTSVRRVFSWSYRCLDPDTARAFRLLGSQPGTDIDEHAAAAMLGVDVAVARRRLRNLVGVNLAVEPARGRFGMHDLLRAYASELDTDREAMRRLLDHYLTTAAAAMASIRPADTRDFEIEPATGRAAALLADPRQAMTWLHTERRNILAAIVFADTHVYPEHAVRLAATTRRYLEMRGYYLDVAQAHDHALNSARSLGDQRAEAITHRNLGVVFGRANRNAEAEEHFRTAIGLYRGTGDRAGEAAGIGNLGLLYLRTSRAGDAETYLRRAVDQALELDLPLCAASDLTALGTLETFLGRYEDAIEHHARAIAGYMAVGLWQTAAAAQDGLGEAYLRLGRYDDARVCLDAALASTEASGNRYGEAATLNNLGELHRLTGRPDDALTCFRRAIDIAAAIGDDRCEAGGHNGVARVMIPRGHVVEATAHLECALAAAVRAEDSQQRVRALIGMALAAGHDLDATRQALDHARAACTALETLEAQEIERLSVRLENGHHAERSAASPPRSRRFELSAYIT